MKRWSILLIITEMQIKTTIRYHLTPVIMAIIKKSTNNKCCRGYGEKEALLHCWTRKLGMLQSMGSQRVRHDWETELNWIEDCLTLVYRFSILLSSHMAWGQIQGAHSPESCHPIWPEARSREHTLLRSVTSRLFPEPHTCPLDIRAPVA